MCRKSNSIFAARSSNAMTFPRFLGPVLLAAVVGCGGSIDTESVTPPEVSPRDAIKTALNQMLESGAPGSEIGAVMTSINDLKQTDPALADTLKADADELMGMMSRNNVDAMKAKAQEMLKKLEGGGT
jgi:hypothetical protein